MCKALRIGASGLRSSWASIARNSSFRRSAERELLHLLPEPRFEDVSLGDVVESRQQRRLSFPLGGDDPHLGDARLTVGEGEVDLGRLAGHDRPAEVALDQAIQGPAQQPDRGGVGVANGPVGRNHQDAIGVPLDHALEPRLAGQKRLAQGGEVSRVCRDMFHGLTRPGPPVEIHAIRRRPGAVLPCP